MKDQFEVSVVSGPVKLDEDGDPVIEHNIKLKINLNMPQHTDAYINRRREEELNADIWSAIESKISHKFIPRII